MQITPGYRKFLQRMGAGHTFDWQLLIRHTLAMPQLHCAADTGSVLPNLHKAIVYSRESFNNCITSCSPTVAVFSDNQGWHMKELHHPILHNIPNEKFSCFPRWAMAWWDLFMSLKHTLSFSTETLWNSCQLTRHSPFWATFQVYVMNKVGWYAANCMQRSLCVCLYCKIDILLIVGCNSICRVQKSHTGYILRVIGGYMVVLP